jgi:hypothetical protein
MCDLVKDETERIDSRFLEPACGDGNFLAEILRRKLEVVKNKYKNNSSESRGFQGIMIFAGQLRCYCQLLLLKLL